MQFFKHMSRMRHDPKIKRLLKKYGVEGYGLYCLIVESIVDSITTESPLPVLEETAEDIADDYRMDIRTVEDIIKFCISQELIEVIPNQNILYCLKVYKFLNTSQTRSDGLRSMIKAASGNDDKQLPYKDLRESIKQAILLEHNDLPDSLLPSETVCDNNDRKEETKTKTIDQEKEEEIKPPHNFGTFTPPPSASDFQSDNVPAISESKDMVPESDTELYNDIKLYFESKQPSGRFTNYGKEGTAIKGLIKKAKDLYPDDYINFLNMITGVFAELRKTDQFYTKQPFLPSSLNSSGIFDRVLNEAQTKYQEHQAASEFDAVAFWAGVK